MAIKANVILAGGIEVKDAYIKVINPIILEKKDSAGKKVFALHYNYEFKKDSSAEKFYSYLQTFDGVDIESNLFTQAYKHLADVLNVPEEEV